jgi:hypothetical protein
MHDIDHGQMERAASKLDPSVLLKLPWIDNIRHNTILKKAEGIGNWATEI